jgi:hypothetical protein
MSRKYNLVGAIKHNHDVIFTFEITETFFFRRLFKRKEKIRITREFYVGYCTVWRVFPEFIRCHTYVERWLADIWSKWEFEGKKEFGPTLENILEINNKQEVE